MNKLTQALQSPQGIIPHIVAGDGGLPQTARYLLELEAAGATMIRLGIPFSDPTAEAGALQRCHLRALESGTTPAGIFAMLEQVLPQLSIPVVLFTYLNPVYRYDYQAFFKDCQRVGVSGVAIADLPLEEKGEVQGISETHQVPLLSFVATGTKERIRRITQQAQGFLTLLPPPCPQQTVQVLQEVRQQGDVPVIVPLESLLSLEDPSEIWGVLVDELLAEALNQKDFSEALRQITALHRSIPQREQVR